MRPRAIASNRNELRRRALIGAAFALLGCNLDNAGDAPPPATLYFPNALALSRHDAGAARYLFVANSNLDLRYNVGTLQAYSLERLQAEIDECEGSSDCTIDPVDVLADEVSIGSFSTSIAYSSAPEDAPSGQDYVFVTTRTDDSLAFVLVDPQAEGDDVLRCAQDDPECHLRAERGFDIDRGETLDWPMEAAAVIAGPLSDWAETGDPARRYALVAHRGGEVSMFVEDTDAEPDSDERFVLSSVLSGLLAPLTNVAFDPATRLAYLTVGNLGIERVGFAPPPLNAEGTLDEIEIHSGTLYAAGALNLEAVTQQPNTRDIAFASALSDAGDRALDSSTALLVAQNPNALLLVELDPARNALNTARVKRTTVVGAGASRVATGVLGGRPTAVVASFDARALFIIDLETMLTRSVVPNLSGPFEIVFDQDRELVYVTDFRSSVIRVVDLSALAQTQGEASARVIATLGAPRVVQELR